MCTLPGEETGPAYVSAFSPIGSQTDRGQEPSGCISASDFADLGARKCLQIQTAGRGIPERPVNSTPQMCWTWKDKWSISTAIPVEGLGDAPHTAADVGRLNRLRCGRVKRKVEHFQSGERSF